MESKDKRRNASIINNIRKRQSETGITDKMMAREMGLATETYRHKRLSPDKLRLEEYRYIINRLGLSEEEILEGLI